MTTGQTILTRKTRYAIFLTLTIEPGGEETVREALAGLAGLTRSVGSRQPEAALTSIIGIGSDAWDRLFTGPRPAALHPFRQLEGETHTAPATAADLLLHLKSDQMDLCFEVGKMFSRQLGDAVRTADEVHGFRYFDLRDVIGFVDGTENPVGQDAIDAITVGPEDRAFAGGSYVAVQRYVTDLAAWDALSVADQEDAIGRSKVENIEMDDEVKPSNSHIALNVIEDADGNEIEIVRDNMPYGQIGGDGPIGTYFIAYSSSPDSTERMLENMFLGDPPGNHDRLLDFTTAVTGAQFFAPSADFLDDLPPAPSTGGSLGIGSLRPRS
ncbi:Dyp-type peroxidase [Gordonia alkaliphila]|uniref:Dyp-type peroxidase n=1 Tax=Gordonia alkaliphila TaxID=1053547 RepID=A0ABP8ZBV8_9ACTN